MSKTAVLSRDFYRDLRRNLRGLPENAKKLTLILEHGKPAIIYLEIYAVSAEEPGQVLTKTYTLVEEPEGEAVNITSLSDDTEKRAWRPKGGYF